MKKITKVNSEKNRVTFTRLPPHVIDSAKETKKLTGKSIQRIVAESVILAEKILRETGKVE
jgi:hypothetical protein